MPYVKLDDVRLFYNVEGSGEPTILLVHGLSCDGGDWLWQVPAFAARGQVVTVDQRGHGHSSAPAEGYSCSRYADDLVGLLDHLGIESAIVAGHSLGGTIVADMAIRHPTRVQALIEVDPAYGFPPEWPAAFAEVARAISEHGPDAMLEPMEALHTDETSDPLRMWHRRNVKAMEITPYVDSILTWANGTEGVVRGPATEAYLARRRCPILSIYADPERAAYDETTFSHPLSRAVAFEGAGHWVHQERPDEFNATVLSWLDTLDTPG